jgi:methylaspartate ammonia-lyase
LRQLLQLRWYASDRPRTHGHDDITIARHLDQYLGHIGNIFDKYQLRLARYAQGMR